MDDKSSVVLLNIEELVEGINGGGRHDDEKGSSFVIVSITALLGRIKGFDCNFLAMSSVKLERCACAKSSRARVLPKSSCVHGFSVSIRDTSGGGELQSTSALLQRGPKSRSLCGTGGV